ncbi:hypothetical protein AB0J02_35460, partial [Streptomyces sp. NPDC050264]
EADHGFVHTEVLQLGRQLEESLPQLLSIIDAVTAGDPDAADAAAEAQLASLIDQLRMTERLPLH